MAIDEIIQRATITLPQPLREDQVKDLLKYVWQNGGYSVTLHEDRRSTLGTIFAEPEKGDEFEQVSIDLSGDLRKPLGRSATFSFYRELGEDSLFSEIRFDTAGYDHGLPEDLAEIFDTIRTHTERYFQECLEPPRRSPF